MRNSIILLLLLLILWITASSYWYVCRVRGDCKWATAATEIQSSDPTSRESESLSNEEAELKASIEEAKTYLAGSGMQQAKLTHEGRWDELKTLNGGAKNSL